MVLSWYGHGAKSDAYGIIEYGYDVALCQRIHHLYERSGHGVTELWCHRVTVVVSQSDGGYVVKKLRLCCHRITVMVLPILLMLLSVVLSQGIHHLYESIGHGVTE
jgi:hypothetical protein